MTGRPDTDAKTGPGPFSSFVELLRRRSQAHPDRSALTFLTDGAGDGQTLTYSELDTRARGVAAQLQRDGVHPGDRALLLFPPGLDYVAAFFGCLYARVIAVPVYPPRLSGATERNLPRLTAIIHDARPGVALTTAATLTAAEAAIARFAGFGALKWTATDCVQASAQDWREPIVAADTLAFLQYTSGSTSTPKGVMVSHRNLLHNEEIIRRAFALDEHSVVAGWLPLYHDMGLIGNVLQPLFVGGRAVMMAPVTFLQRPLSWLEMVSRFRATCSGGPNFAYDLCVRKVTSEQRHALDLSTWRVAYNGSEPIRADTIARFAEHFAGCGFRRTAFLPCYGLAEATLFVSGGPADSDPACYQVDKAALERGEVVTVGDSGASTVKTLVASGEIRAEAKVTIVDPETRIPLPPNRVGEIWVEGASVAQGYWQRPEVSAETFAARLAGDGRCGHLRTGDLGFLIDGQLVVTSRLKDLIIVNGRNHAPQDVELTVACSHAALRPGCGAAFTVDSDDGPPERLVIVHEVERQSRKVEVDQVATAVRQAVAEEHELPVDTLVLIKPGTIPKTSNGKLQRDACRKAYLAGSLPVLGRSSRPAAKPSGSLPVSADTPSTSEVTEAAVRGWILAGLAARLKLEPAEIDPDAPFASYGLVSADAVGLIGDLQERLGRRLSPTLAYEHPSVAALARHLGGPSAQMVAPPSRRAVAGREPIAIVGIGCRFPMADGPEPFWKLLRDGKDAVTEVPADRWNAEAFYDPDPDVPGKTNTRWGGFLRDIDQFDACFFGISPREASRQDPQQRVLLEVAWQALEDAGIPPDDLTTTATGVFVGICANEYGPLQTADPSQIDAYVGTGNALSVAANRISYQLGLRGPSLAVDTACSSSLVAVLLACRSIWEGECTLALAGGVNVILSPSVTIGFTKAGVMSPDGRCKTFDARADGYVRGEGAGLVVLKPVSQALLDGDRVYAVIRGGALGHDGRTNGLMAPSPQAQEAILRDACRSAGVSPGGVQYVEAHGTGTSLGDAIEAQALGAVFGSERPAGEDCRIGSVKTNIGHLEAAAGVAGLIKVALALHHRALPPNLHFAQPNPHIPFETLRLSVQDALTPWPDESHRLLAGVSSFGFGGTNAHLILEEGPRETLATGVNDAPRGKAHLLVLSGRVAPAVRGLAQKYAAWLARDGGPGESLTDVCHTAAVGRAHHEHRLAVVGRSSLEIASRLRAWADGVRDPSVSSACVSASRPRIVFVFPGQGSQWVGMGRELFAAEPAFRDALERCDREVREVAGFSVIEELRAEADRSRLEEIDVLQPALFSLQAALAHLWRSWGVEPDAVVGHSMGEVTAAHVAGALDLPDAARVICHRSRLMKRLRGQGAMAVASLSMEAARQLATASNGRLCVAASNSPTSVALSGDPSAIAGLVEQLRGRNVFCRPVKVDVAAHSMQMDPLCPELVHSLAGLTARTAALPTYSTVTASVQDGTAFDAAYWGRNLRETVRFSEAIAELSRAGHGVFLEVSPHPVLTAPIQQVLTASHAGGAVLASTQRDESEREAMLRTLGALYSLGSPIRWRSLHGVGRCVSVPGYAWQRRRHWHDASAGARPSVARTAVGMPRNGSPELHPLLGRQIALGLQDVVFESHVSLASHPFLRDHRVYEKPVFPATAYLEMCVAAAGHLGCRAAVENLVIQKALMLLEDEGQVLQLLLRPRSSEWFDVEIVSRRSAAPASAAWTVHATASIHRAPNLPEDVDKGVVAAEELPAAVSAADHYARYERCGIQYGPAFRGVVSIRQRNGQALGVVELPEVARAEAPRYQFHPALLDGAFQVLEACLSAKGIAEEGRAYMPIGLEKYDLFMRPGTRCSSRVTLRSGPSAGNETLVADIDVRAEDGRRVAHAKGLSLKRARVETLAPAGSALSDCVYEVQWRPAEPPVNARTQADGVHRWLVLSDRGGVGSALRERILAQGGNAVLAFSGDRYAKRDDATYVIDATQPDSFGAFLTDLESSAPFSRIVHLWNLDSFDGPVADESLARLLALRCGSVLGLVRALSRAPSPEPPRLFVVTREAQCTSDTSPLKDPFAAGVWGLGRTLAVEEPGLWGGLVDLDGAAPPDAAAELFVRITEAGREDQLALRNGRVFVPRLVRSGPAPARTPHLAAEGTYLVTGGLGALGLHCAAWLVKHGARRLVLVGRSGLPDRASWESIPVDTSDGRRIAEIRGLESAAHVAVLRADVGDRAQVEALVHQIGPSLRGIVHAAGITQARAARTIDFDSLQAMLRPKVLGGWYLHELTKCLSLDFFVLFSSAASVWGSKGLAHYAAANAFLDALAHHRRTLGRPALSVNWARFSEAGMVADEEQEALGRIGVEPLPVETALSALGSLLESGVTQRTVAAVDWACFKPIYEARQERPFLSSLGSNTVSEIDRPRTRSRLLSDAQAAPRHRRRAVLLSHLRTMLAEILGFPAGELPDPKRGFFELGMDSIMAVQLKKRLEAGLDHTFPTTIAFDHPTLDSLADYLESELYPADSPRTPIPVLPAAPASNLGEPDLSLLAEEDLVALLAKEVAEIKEGSLG